MDELLKQKQQLSDMLVDAINYNNKDKVLELAMKAAMVIDKIKSDSRKEEDTIVCARCNNKYPESDITECESPLYICDSYLCKDCYKIGIFCPRCEADGDSISVCDRCSRAWPSSKTYECSNTECVGTCLCQECYNDFDKKCRTCYDRTAIKYTCCICNENFCDTDVKSCGNEDCIKYICTNCSDNGEITLCPGCEEVVQFCSECQEMLFDDDDMTKHTDEDGTVIVCCESCASECDTCGGISHPQGYTCNSENCEEPICDECYENNKYCPECTTALGLVDDMRLALNNNDQCKVIGMLLDNDSELHDNFIDNDTLNIVVTDQWKDDGWGEIQRKLKDVTPGSEYYFVDGYGNYKDVTDEMLSDMIDELEKKTIGSNERIDD